MHSFCLMRRFLEFDFTQRRPSAKQNNNDDHIDLEETLKKAALEYKDDMSFQTGFAKAVSILQPEITKRDDKLINIKRVPTRTL